jgi:hypothetical protein
MGMGGGGGGIGDGGGGDPSGGGGGGGLLKTTRNFVPNKFRPFNSTGGYQKFNPFRGRR